MYPLDRQRRDVDRLTQWRLSGLNFSDRLGDFDPSLFYDKEQITVDNNPSSPHYGRIYVTYVKFHMQPDGFSDYCPVQLAYTDNVDPNGDGDLTRRRLAAHRRRARRARR